MFYASPLNTFLYIILAKNHHPKCLPKRCKKNNFGVFWLSDYKYHVQSFYQRFSHALVNWKPKIQEKYRLVSHHVICTPSDVWPVRQFYKIKFLDKTLKIVCFVFFVCVFCFVLFCFFEYCSFVIQMQTKMNHLCKFHTRETGGYSKFFCGDKI